MLRPTHWSLCYNFAKCSHRGKLGVLVFQHCGNKAAPTGWLNTTEICSVTVLEARGHQSRWWPGHAPSEAFRAESVPLPASGSSSHSSVYASITSSNASLFTLLSSLFVSPFPCLFSSYTDTIHIKWGLTPMTSIYNCKDYFHNRSCLPIAQFLVIRTSTYLLGGRVQYLILSKGSRGAICIFSHTPHVNLPLS